MRSCEAKKAERYLPGVRIARVSRAMSVSINEQTMRASKNCAHDGQPPDDALQPDDEMRSHAPDGARDERMWLRGSSAEQQAVLV